MSFGVFHATKYIAQPSLNSLLASAKEFLYNLTDKIGKNILKE
jgi:hypothetical protein